MSGVSKKKARRARRWRAQLRNVRQVKREGCEAHGRRSPGSCGCTGPPHRAHPAPRAARPRPPRRPSCGSHQPLRGPRSASFPPGSPPGCCGAGRTQDGALLAAPHVLRGTRSNRAGSLLQPSRRHAARPHRYGSRMSVCMRYSRYSSSLVGDMTWTGRAGQERTAQRRQQGQGQLGRWGIRPAAAAASASLPAGGSTHLVGRVLGRGAGARRARYRHRRLPNSRQGAGDGVSRRQAAASGVGGRRRWQQRRPGDRSQTVHDLTCSSTFAMAAGRGECCAGPELVKAASALAASPALGAHACKPIAECDDVHSVATGSSVRRSQTGLARSFALCRLYNPQQALQDAWAVLEAR